MVMDGLRNVKRFHAPVIADTGLKVATEFGVSLLLRFAIVFKANDGDSATTTKTFRSTISSPPPTWTKYTNR